MQRLERFKMVMCSVACVFHRDTALLDYLDSIAQEQEKWPNKIYLRIRKLPSPADARAFTLPLNIQNVFHCSVCPVLPNRW